MKRIGRVLGVLGVGGWAMLSVGPAGWAGAGGGEDVPGLPSTDYAQVLKSAVDARGRVNYRQLKAEPDQLDAFLASVGRLTRDRYTRWGEQQQIAFWLNVYNVATLQAIVSNYPIKPTLRGVRHPRNSIRQISGVWDKRTFMVMGEPMTLDHMEHQELRKRFDEPRIHMALVCAAKGCPPLRDEPYEAARLDAQLDDQARRFVSGPSRFRIDRDKGVVHLSAIFEWFGGDFVARYAEGFGRDSLRPAQRGVLGFVSRYLGDGDREFLSSGTYGVEFLPYDWSLNES